MRMNLVGSESESCQIQRQSPLDEANHFPLSEVEASLDQLSSEAVCPAPSQCLDSMTDIDFKFPKPRQEEMMEDSTISATEFTQPQHEMLERLSKDPKIIVKSQQRDEPDLSSEQKLDHLKKVFSTQPEKFLIRFGKHLKATDSPCFDQMREEGKEGILFHLSEIETSWKTGARERRMKNRRYEALKKLVETSDYFSEEEMQRRNPILYEQLIGKYHTEEERAAFLQQSWKSTSGSGTSSMPLTDMFLAHLERTPEGISCRRMEQECQQDEEDEADAEYDSDEDYDMDSPHQSGTSRGDRSSRGKPSVNNEEGPREEIDDEEKDLLKEEFFTTMYRNFLNGKDEDFDYSTVDDNPEYDCGENLENDEEDKYFDEEEPCEVSEPNSDLDDQFRPPVRSSEIESKIEKLSVASSKSDKTPDEKSDGECAAAMVEDDDEDELDAYMREIEKQLQK